MNNLLSIFIEAAHRASIVPMASEATIYAVKSFATQPMLLPVAVAIVGALLGHGFNLWLGRALMRLPSSPKNEHIYLRIQLYFNRYGFVLLALAFLPLGNILVVAAGLLATPIKKALPAIAVGLLYFYGQLLFS